MIWLTPREPETYLAAAALYAQLRSTGVTIRSTVDCLIAVLCAEGQALLLTADMDFQRIESSELVPLRLLRPL